MPIHTEEKNMNDDAKDYAFDDRGIQVLIDSTSRYLEDKMQEFGYEDEKPTPDQLVELAKNIEVIAEVRRGLFFVREHKDRCYLTMEVKLRESGIPRL